MAKRKKQEVNEDVFVDLNQAQAQAQNFVDRNQKLIVGIAAGFLIIVGGLWAYQNFVKIPKEKEAVNQMSEAQFYFEQDSFAKALTNPGNGFPGLVDFIDQYGSTKAGNLANYYAGVSYLHEGRIKVAVDYLKDFKPAGKITPAMKLGLLGDAYSENSEIQNMDKALSYYKKAANATENEFTSPYYLQKAGMLAESQGKKDQALKFYEQIKKEYPLSQQGQGIDKYISRVK